MWREDKKSPGSRILAMIYGYIAVSVMTGALLYMETLDHSLGLKRWLQMCGGLAVIFICVFIVLEGLRAFGLTLETHSVDQRSPKSRFAASIGKRIVSLFLKLSLLISWGWLYLTVHGLDHDQILNRIMPAWLLLFIVIFALVDEIRMHAWARFGPKRKSKRSHLA